MSLKRFMCSFCRKCFSSETLLRQHEADHLIKRVHKCNDCDQLYSQSYNLHKHIREKHPDLGNYKCSKCFQCFSQESSLNQHIRILHQKTCSKTQYPCNHCSCVFKTEIAVTRHETLFHKKVETPAPDPNEVKGLAKKFLEQFKSLQKKQQVNLIEASTNSLQQLKNKENPGHQNGIYETSKEISVIEQPTSQIVVLTDRLFPTKKEQYLVVQSVKRANGCYYKVCEFCAMEFSKSYDFIRHRRKHTKEKPFLCHLCSKSFIIKSKLNEHLKSHLADKKSKNLKRREDPELKMLQEFLPEPIAMKVEGNQVINQHNNDKVIFDFFKIAKNDCSTNQEANHPKCESSFPLLGSNNNLQMKAASKCNIGNSISFTCHLCLKKRFFIKSELEDHLVQEHENKSFFKCPYCEDIFKTKATCKNHMKDHLRNLLDLSQPSQIVDEIVKHEKSTNTENFDDDSLFLNDIVTQFAPDPTEIKVEILEDKTIGNDGLSSEEQQFFNDMQLETDNMEPPNQAEIEFERYKNEEDTKHVVYSDLNSAHLNNPSQKDFLKLEDDDDIIEQNGISPEAKFLFNEISVTDIESTESAEIDFAIFQDEKLTNIINPEADPLFLNEIPTAAINWEPPELIVLGMLSNQHDIYLDNFETGVENNNTLHPCKYCTSIFSKANDLRTHLRTHTHEKAFLCNECNKSFALKSSLNDHLPLSKAESHLHPCEVCGKKSTTDKPLNLHLSFHTNDGIFCCEKCGSRYRTFDHLISHLKDNKCNFIDNKMK